MNKKIENSIANIYNGFTIALKNKSYKDITIQDILDESHVSRSTFYAHFKTKEDLLNSLSKHIFQHVFSHTLKEEETHDFSKSSIFDYKHLITHIFYHLKDEKELLDAILLEKESKTIFFEYFKDELKELAHVCVMGSLLIKKDVPNELRERQFINNFLITIEYWQKNKYLESPEIITEYFINLN